MSFWVVYKAGIEGNRILAEVADSSIRPLRHFQATLGDENKSIKENLTAFIKNYVDGNFHLRSSCRFYPKLRNVPKFTDRALSAIAERDWKYKTSYYKEVSAMISCHAAEMMLSGQIVEEGAFGYIIADTVARQDAECGEIQELRDKGDLVFVRSAAVSDMFPGWVVLCDEENQVILAERLYYSDNGILDNSCGTARFFGPGTDCLFDLLARGSKMSLTQICGGRQKAHALAAVLESQIRGLPRKPAPLYNGVD